MLKLLSSCTVIIRKIIYFLNNFAQLLISIKQKCPFKPVNIYYMLATLIRSSDQHSPVASNIFTRWVNSRAVALWKQFTLGINFYFSSVLSIPLSESTARKRLITPRCTVFKKYQSEHRMSLLASLQRLYHVHVTGIPK